MRNQSPTQIALVVIFHGDKLLFIQRANEPAKESWTFVSGHVEQQETPFQAAEREAKEEVGLAIEIKKKLKSHNVTLADERYCIHCFVAISRDQFLQLNFKEVTEAKWLRPTDGLKLNLGPVTRRILEEFS